MKNPNKIFSFFWLVSGLIWAAASIRRFLVRADITGVVIYALCSLVSFVLSAAFSRGWIKRKA